MDKKKRSYLRIIGWGCTFVFLFLFVWIGIVWLNRPAYIEPDTSTFETGDVFFSVGDSWESVAVRTLSGSLSLEVADSTPSHCGIVVRYAEGVKLAHASTVKKKIVLETPEEYLRNNGSYCIYTRKAPCTVDTLAIRQSVETLVKNRVPFDFNFDHSTSKALYCTEMVVRVFEQNNCFCFSKLRHNSYMYPNDLLKLCKDKVRLHLNNKNK